MIKLFANCILSGFLFHPPERVHDDVIDDYYFPYITVPAPWGWPFSVAFSPPRNERVSGAGWKERVVSTRDSANREPASRWINTPSSNCGVTIEGARKKPFPARSPSPLPPSPLPRYHPLKTRRYARRYHADDSELDAPIEITDLIPPPSLFRVRFERKNETAGFLSSVRASSADNIGGKLFSTEPPPCLSNYPRSIRDKITRIISSRIYIYIYLLSRDLFMSRKFRSWNMVDGDEIRRGETMQLWLLRMEQCFFPSPKDQVENYGEILSEIKSV